MKKLILTAILASTQFAHADFQEQVMCQLPNFGPTKAILIESGTYKRNPNGYGVIIDNPGTLTLLGPNGMIEKVTPFVGVGGFFNEYQFPASFIYENDATKRTVLKFETKQLGSVYISYVCNRPNSMHCNLNDYEPNQTFVSLNINGKGVLKFNGQALPFCSRRVVKQ